MFICQYETLLVDARTCTNLYAHGDDSVALLANSDRPRWFIQGAQILNHHLAVLGAGI